MKFLKIIFLFIITTYIAHAAPSNDLTALLNSTTSMQASFTQTIYDNHNKPVQTSYGKMALQRPGKFRWEVSKPIPQLIIANDSKLWIYDPDLEQVTIRALKQATGDAPALFLSHTNASLDKDYTVKSLQKSDGKTRWFSLASKSPDSMFASVEMGFNNNQIKEMNMADHLGHVTKVQFNNIKTNINLSPSQFVFKAKSGIDVIDETRKQ